MGRGLSALLSSESSPPEEEESLWATLSCPKWKDSMACQKELLRDDGLELGT